MAFDVLVLLQVLEIKRLNGAIAALKSELGKHQERLEECKRCGTPHHTANYAACLSDLRPCMEAASFSACHTKS